MFTASNNPQQDIRRRVPTTATKAVTILPRPPSMTTAKDDPSSASAVNAPASDPVPLTNAAPSPSSAAENGATQTVGAAHAPTAEQKSVANDSAPAKCQTNKLGSRKMTHDVEEQVLAAWGNHVNEYYGGVRRRVFKKIALQLNDVIQEPPFFTEKQVENKITYMEKRYKTIREKYAASGFSADDLSEKHMRTQVERTFPLFFKVHQVIGERTASEAPEDDAGSNMLNFADPTSAKRGRKRKRSVNGTAPIDTDNVNQGCADDPPATEILEDSDIVADDDEGSVSSPKQKSDLSKQKRDVAELNKRFKKKPKIQSGSRFSMAETVSRNIMKQMEADEKHRSEVLQIMRNELDMKQAQFGVDKALSEHETSLVKIQEMRRIAELYMNLGEKEKAKSLLDEARELLATF